MMPANANQFQTRCSQIHEEIGKLKSDQKFEGTEQAVWKEIAKNFDTHLANDTVRLQKFFVVDDQDKQHWEDAKKENTTDHAQAKGKESKQEETPFTHSPLFEFEYAKQDKNAAEYRSAANAVIKLLSHAADTAEGFTVQPLKGLYLQREINRISTDIQVGTIDTSPNPKQKYPVSASHQFVKEKAEALQKKFAQFTTPKKETQKILLGLLSTIQQHTDSQKQEQAPEHIIKMLKLVGAASACLAEGTAESLRIMHEKIAEAKQIEKTFLKREHTSLLARIIKGALCGTQSAEESMGLLSTK